MVRTHWESEEFWKMFEPAEKYVREAGATEEEVKISMDAALTFWLMLTTVAGFA